MEGVNWIEIALSATDRPYDLYTRCQTILNNGNSIGDLIMMLTEHPLASSTNVDASELTVLLKHQDRDRIRTRFVYSLKTKTWAVEKMTLPGGNWTRAEFSKPK
jgi:hypothetical protein